MTSANRPLAALLTLMFLLLLGGQSFAADEKATSTVAGVMRQIADQQNVRDFTKIDLSRVPNGSTSRLELQAAIEKRAEALCVGPDIAVDFTDDPELCDVPDPWRCIRSSCLIHLIELASRDISGSLRTGHGELLIAHCCLDGALNASGAEIPIALRFKQVEFLNDVNFVESHFRRSLEMRGCEFQGNANFIRARVDKNFDLSEFKDEQAINHFNAFHQDAYFSHIHVVDDLNCSGVRFEHSAYFDSADVGLSLDLSDATFGKPTSTSKSNLGESYFVYLSVGRILSFENVVSNVPLQLEGSHVGDLITLDGCSVDSFDLSNVATQDINLRYKVLTNAAGCSLANLTANRYWMGDNARESSTNILTLLNEVASVDRANYSDVEKSFRSQGAIGSANEVYYAYRRRIREGMPFYARCADWLLYELVGYGRSFVGVFIVAALVIVAGCFIWDPARMISVGTAPFAYSRWWYSLDLFAPLIDLRADKAWIPRTSWRAGVLLMRLQRIVGFVLVPLALAALAGWFGAR